MYGLVQFTPECCCDSHGLKFLVCIFCVWDDDLREANVIKRWGMFTMWTKIICFR